MSEGSKAGFWYVLRPSAWPQPPSWMSFSTLKELESCPRRWALRTATYPDLWKYGGYPDVPQSRVLEGTIVHSSLQRIMGALVARRCPSLLDESAILTLKELGGYTATIMTNLERVLLAYKENPRVSPALSGIRNQLISRVPELRIKVQKLLSRIRLEPRAVRPGETVGHREGELRNPLRHGSHPEVLLQSSQLGWRGFADIVTLLTMHCEIRDFKTGSPKEEHKEQLLIYALLWARDRDLNPSAQLADRLVLSYDETDIEVPPPDVSMLRSLADELKERSAAVVVDLQSVVPEARTSFDTCVYCPVRHLCEEYWPWLTREWQNRESVKVKSVDIQIKLCSRHGPTSWDAVLECGPAMKVGGPILLRTESPAFELHPGQRLRVLSVQLTVPVEEGIVDTGSSIIATMGSRSEMFLVSK